MHFFTNAYRRFRKPIFHYVRSRIADIQVAEEVTQEIFLKVFRFSDSFDETRELSTWIWTIARNTVYDVLRRKNDSEEPGELENFESPLENAEALLEKRDRWRMLRTVLKPLTKLQRRVLWLRVVRQLSYEEISRQLGLSLSAAKNLAYRAKLTIHGAPVMAGG
jgi:RNA polymerase sigma-70 factor (ECF subfamily)